jgi:hypothetical protein
LRGGSSGFRIKESGVLSLLWLQPFFAIGPQSMKWISLGFGISFEKLGK